LDIVSSGLLSYEKRVREVLGSFPSWFVEGSRISQIVVVQSPQVRAEKAIYAHKSRVLSLSPGLGDILRMVLAHEMSHGVDDGEPEESPHRFSRSPEWTGIWRQVPSFTTRKYRDSPQEYFADAMASAIVSGIQTYSLAHPYEGAYITQVVVPRLMGKKG
jgi:hypothetical protein